MKLTPWYPPSVKPMRPGVYQTTFFPYCVWLKLYSRWSGTCWFWQCPNKRDAATTTKVGDQDKHWRGLAEEP